MTSRIFTTFAFNELPHSWLVIYGQNRVVGGPAFYLIFGGRSVRTDYAVWQQI